MTELEHKIHNLIVAHIRAGGRVLVSKSTIFWTHWLTFLVGYLTCRLILWLDGKLI